MLRLLILSIVILLLSMPLLRAQFPWVADDKQMHFLGSAYLLYWNYHLNNQSFNYSHQQNIIMSVSLTSLIGIGKEFSDKYLKKTRFCWYDMAYNIAGITLGVIIIQAQK